ncbi:hypothetical protein HK099_001787, partial [Clydaea vesicula]
VTLFGFFLIGLYAGKAGIVKDKDVFLTSRGSQTWISLATNFFSCGLGIGLFYTLPPFGALFGLVGVFAYTLSAVFPILVLIILGPWIREQYPKGITLTQMVKQRYGWIPQIMTNLVSLIYMSVFLITELSALQTLLEFFGINALPAQIVIIIMTTIYTTISGMKASILTDKFQGFFVFGLMILATIAFGVNIRITPEQIAGSPISTPTRAGWESFFTLTVALLGANLFHQGYWQRVYAAESNRELTKACLGAAAMTFLLFFLAGFVGVASRWGGYVDIEVDPTATMAFFNVLTTLPSWINVLVIVMGGAFICSSVDNLQNAITALIMEDLFQGKLHLHFARVAAVIVNVVALIIARQNLTSIFILFLIADLVACFIALPLVFGFVQRNDAQKKVNGFDFTIGVISGFIGVILFGATKDGTGFDIKSGIAILALPNGLNKEVESAVVFLIAPAASFIMLFVSSFLRNAILKALGKSYTVVNKPTLFNGPGTGEELPGNGNSTGSSLAK